MNKAALLYSTGFQTNLGAISALAEVRHFIIICDRANHASIFDGYRLYFGKTLNLSIMIWKI